jgi:hypothetical protein
MRHPIAGLIFLVSAGWGLSAAAEIATDCEARADAVVAKLEADAAEPLSERELELAREAAIAGCGDDETSGDPIDPPAEPKPARAEKPEQSASQRFWAGLLSFENKNVKTRAGGKYKYDADRK